MSIAPVNTNILETVLAPFSFLATQIAYAVAKVATVLFEGCQFLVTLPFKLIGRSCSVLCEAFTLIVKTIINLFEGIIYYTVATFSTILDMSDPNRLVFRRQDAIEAELQRIDAQKTGKDVTTIEDQLKTLENLIRQQGTNLNNFQDNLEGDLDKLKRTLIKEFFKSRIDYLKDGLVHGLRTMENRDALRSKYPQYAEHVEAIMKEKASQSSASSK